MTIPRLELLSAVTWARLAKSMIKTLDGWKLDKINIWLDSLTALYWIANNGAWKPFVNNRVKEIHETIPKATWYHCPTEINPSDMGTRGVTASRLQHSPLWWEGPTFLKREKEHWRKQPANFQPDEEATIEERSPTLTVVNEGSIKLTEEIDLRRFSSLRRILGCVARMKRFINNCRTAKDSRVTSQVLSIEKLRETREWIVKAMQKDMKGDAEYEARARDLGAYLHTDGFIRRGGRLNNTSLTFDQKDPILLPTRHKVTELIVQECHQRIGHEKVNRTLAEVRAQYWIPRGRQLMKSIIKGCQQCRLLSGSHLKAPAMAPLPDTTVVRTRPFQHTGVDFAGPLYLKAEKGKTSKSYLALFTCATTRAVNLELVEDMTVSTFKLALERFIAAWGVPNLIISDNGSTFRATAVDLHQLYEHPEVQAYLANNYITWNFNLALAPWWGGWFEKMVGLTKGILRRCLGKPMLRFREMEVVLKKVQAILNNRPLCYQGEELEEESMTPNHLIFGHRLVQMPDIPMKCSRNKKMAKCGLNTLKQGSTASGTVGKRNIFLV
eukprot:gene784-biopygen61